MYILLDVTHELLTSKTFESFKNVYKYNHFALIVFEGSSYDTPYNGMMMFLDLASGGKLVGDFMIKDSPKISLFKSDKFYAVSTDNHINIFQLAKFI